MIPSPDPDRRVTERDREIAIEQVQRAMAEGHVRFGDLDDRFEAIYAAESYGELVAVSADLPTPPPPEAAAPVHPIAPVSYSLFGDMEVGGWIGVEGDVAFGSGFGDVVVDLSSARIHNDCVVRARTIFGDVTVILPDGVRATLESTTVFGSRTERLSEPVPGLPYVRVVTACLFGDVKLYSLSQVPEGKLQKLWRALRRK